MIDILNEEVKDKTGKKFKVVKQENNYITLSNNKKYDYITMFSSSTFILIEEDLQKQVLEDIKKQLEEKQKNELEESTKAELEKEWQEVENLMNDKLTGRVVSQEHGIELAMQTEFVFKKQYGGKALTIYENGIKHLNFNPAKKHFFGLQQILYAQDCTKEGYSVWMLPYSTLNGKSNGSWANFIEIENNEIIQYSFVNDAYHHRPDEKRLTFVKQKNGNYVFLGVYSLKERITNYFNNSKCVAKEIYSLISENYPEKRIFNKA